MNIVIILFTLLFISCIGYAIIRGFGLLSAKDNLLAIGCSYGLGVGCVTAQLYLYTRISLPWDRWWILVPWVVFFVLFVISRRNDEKSQGRSLSDKYGFKITNLSRSKFGIIEKALLLGIFISIFYSPFEALLRPVVAWDAWANWLMQAKVFFLEGGIDPRSLAYMDSEYPLTINLLGTFIYIMLGFVDDTAVLLTSTAFYVFLAITFFAVLYKQYGLRYALVFTFLLVTTQNFIRHGGRLEAGLADLPLGYFAFISVITLFRYFETQKTNVLFLVSILLGITAVIKFEGIPLSFLIVCCAVFFIFQKRLYRQLPILFFWVAPYAIWQIDRVVMQIPNQYFSQAHPQELSFRKSFNAFLGTAKELLSLKSWNLLWITYFYSLVFLKAKKNREIIVLHFIILSQLTLYLLIYNVTAGNNPESSIERLLMHIAPLAFYAIALTIKKERLFGD